MVWAIKLMIDYKIKLTIENLIKVIKSHIKSILVQVVISPVIIDHQEGPGYDK